MKFSVLTNDRGPLNKTIDVKDGKLVKSHPDPMHSGTIKRFDTTLEKFAKGLSNLTDHNALVHGIVKGAKEKEVYQVVTAKQHQGTPKDGCVSRSLDCIEFRGTHLSMLDHDPDEQCPHPYLSPSALLNILSEIDPQWKDVAHCVVYSTSAGLSVGGKPVSVNAPGYHLYFEAENAEQLNAYLTAIFRQSAINGHGWIKLSSNGAMNIRSCFDNAVYSPERIDFTAAPTLKSDRLSQERPEPAFFPGKKINCSQIPDVDEEEYQAAVKALKGVPETVKRSKDMAEKRAVVISKERDIPVDEARKLVAGQSSGDLYHNDEVKFKKYGPVRVSEILINLDTYNLAHCADPCEPGEGTSKAILYANDGEKPLIHSMLHGGGNFFLHGNDFDCTPTIEELATMSPLEYDACRKEIAKARNIRVTTLDKEVEKLQRPETATDAAFEELEPWEEEVDGIQLLNDIRYVIKRHLIIHDSVDVAISLWVLLTYCFNEFRILPLLGITSPEKRCGKTTCSEVLHGLVNKAVVASNISSAVLYRIMGKYQPTMLVDEADTFLVDNDELRGVFNAGHTRKSAFVWRCNGETNEPEKFSVWGPKAVLMIGELPETMKDRAIPVRMRRKTPDENVERVTLDFDDEHLHIRRKCVRWCEDNSLKGIEPESPKVGNDRATDNWLPLLAIAEQAGGDWPELARAAMRKLESSCEDERASIGQMLLYDIREIFTDAKLDKISSNELVEKLVATEDRPWPEWRRGNPLTQNSLSRLLKPYRIGPKTIRLGDKTAKGYEVEQFAESFKRYIHSQPPPFQTVTPSQLRNFNELGSKQTVTSNTNVTVEKRSNYLKKGVCDGVTVGNPSFPDGGIKLGEWEEI